MQNPIMDLTLTSERYEEEGQFRVASLKEEECSKAYGDCAKVRELKLKVKPLEKTDGRIEVIYLAEKNLTTGEGSGFYKKCLESISPGDVLLINYEDRNIQRNDLWDCLPHILPLAETKTIQVQKTPTNEIKRLKGIPLNWIAEQMCLLALNNGIPEQAMDTGVHSLEVYKLAREIAETALKNERKKHNREFPFDRWRSSESRLYKELDISTLEKACMIHDIGRMFTGSDASRKLQDYTLHGILGRDFLLEKSRLPEYEGERQGLESYARVCERHMGGAGLTADTNARLKLGDKDTLAESLIEKIVGYSDWRIHAEQYGSEVLKAANINKTPGKIFLPKRVDVAKAYERAMKYKPSQAQLDALVSLEAFINNLIKG